MKVPCLPTRSKGETPLHTAMQNEDIEIVLLLVNTGCDPNAPNHREKTPVHIAAASNNTKLIGALESSKHELDWTKKDYQGLRPTDLIRREPSPTRKLGTPSKSQNLTEKEK